MRSCGADHNTKDDILWIDEWFVVHVVCFQPHATRALRFECHNPLNLTKTFPEANMIKEESRRS